MNFKVPFAMNKLVEAILVLNYKNFMTWFLLVYSFHDTYVFAPHVIGATMLNLILIVEIFDGVMISWDFFCTFWLSIHTNCSCLFAEVGYIYSMQNQWS